jgi:hypothetical protein
MGFMKYGILTTVLLGTAFCLHAQQNGIFSVWSDEVLKKADTAAGSEFLNEDEKQVILIINLARADGAFFAETFLKNYLVLKKKEGNWYIRSLFQDLQKVKNLPMLVPEKDLYDIARDHATRSGMKGYQGHKGFLNRYNEVMSRYAEVGESIYYGKYTPAEIVLQLLIDEGIEDLVHRENFLYPRFNSIGVSIKPHKDFSYNCVISFGLLPRTYEDFIQ